jgi:hypothetical protein
MVEEEKNEEEEVCYIYLTNNINNR